MSTSDSEPEETEIVGDRWAAVSLLPLSAAACLAAPAAAAGRERPSSLVCHWQESSRLSSMRRFACRSESLASSWVEAMWASSSSGPEAEPAAPEPADGHDVTTEQGGGGFTGVRPAR